MPGGFAPRYGAFVLGVILFTTSNVVSENVTPPYLVKKERAWFSNPVCRASAVSMFPMTGSFDKRFHRKAATGCFFTDKPNRMRKSFLHFLIPHQALWMGHTFTKADFPHDNKTGLIIWPKNWMHPDPSNPDVDKDLRDLKEWRNGYCYYQCITWAEIAFSDLVGQLGMIFAGAAVVVKITDSISGYVGWPLVDEDTDIKTLQQIWDVSTDFGWAPGPFKCLAIQICKIFHKSRCFCAIQLISMDYAAFYLADIIDVDGFYTVDFYVSWVMILSAMIAVTLRLWSPFSMAPMIYTRKLWTEGEDKFIDLSVTPPKMAKCDLFEWLHLTSYQRMHHLTMYARRVGLDSIKEKENAENPKRICDEDERHWEEKEDCFYLSYMQAYSCLVKLFTCNKREVKKKKTEKDKPSDMDVICLKQHESDREIDVRGPDGSIIITRRRFTIPLNARGVITGKTAGGKLLVDWKIKAAFNQQEGVETLESDPLYVSQMNKHWEAFMKKTLDTKL